ncbi:MAG: elongation factor P [Phycisphaerae bacterium]|jgi:elongation factor P
MSQTAGLRKGMVIRHEGHLFSVVDFHVTQSGKQKPTVHVKLRALRDGRPVERTLAQLGEIDEVASEVREMQYLYATGHERVFMDLKNYEQYNVDTEQLGGDSEYLVEEQTYRFLSIEGRPVSLQLPAAMVLEVVDTAPPEHAGGGASVFKEARLNTGRMAMVPLFIKTGDRIRVSTDTGEYQGKEH